MAAPARTGFRPNLMALAVPLVLTVLLFTGTAAASGSGYNLSYSRSPGTVSVASVDLIAVSSTDSGGNNITAFLQVSGTLVLNSMTTAYWVWFGGSSTANSTAWVYITNNTLDGTYYTSNGGFSSGTVLLTTGNGGSSVSFSIAKTVVGSASNFAINVYAWTGSVSSATVSWLGTNYQGGGSCANGICASTSATPFFSGYVLYGTIAAVIAVVAIVALLLVLRRRRPSPQPAPPPPSVGMAPAPPPPPAAPPPPPS